MEILCLFATSSEAGIMKSAGSGSSSASQRHIISTLVSGVGSVATAWHLKNYLCSGNRPDIIINAGIAGSFREALVPGDIVMPVSDLFADLGMEEEGGFRHLGTTPFFDANAFPFTGGKIILSNRYTDMLSEIFKPADAITVNTVTGTELTAERLKRIYNPDIETMEGAAVFYVCAMEKIPCIALRAVSNYAGPREKGRWDADKALKSLASGLTDLLKKLEEL